ncbi:MAG TPA: hypothetical protein VMA53_14955 [Stellaceae bacterium]|nr:hypothetical protein [Stellaceae bacterium]
MNRGVSSGQGAAALSAIATISTSLSGPVHDDRLFQKGRVTSLHNHEGHRHVRVRRDLDTYAQNVATQGKIHAPGKILQIFFSVGAGEASKGSARAQTALFDPAAE